VSIISSFFKNFKKAARLKRRKKKDAPGQDIVGALGKIPRELSNLLGVIRPYTLSSPLRLSMLYGIVKEVCDAGISGDIVECGVWNGGSAAIMASALQPYLGRSIWLYDSFKGMPEPGAKDGDLAGDYSGKYISSMESVKKVINKVGVPLDRVIIKKGLFEKTFREDIPGKIALLHIDADWYSSVLGSLQTFYPLVTDGGFVVLDDFGHWEGTREAFYDFCQTSGIKPLLERAGYTQAFWKKGQLHSRGEQDSYAKGIYLPDLATANQLKSSRNRN
jgi:O-methyltransferase